MNNDVIFQPASLLTREELLDHVKHPRNRGELPGADVVREEANPLCGDVVTIYAALRESNLVSRCSFLGSGCIISQAAASILTEYAGGKTFSDIQRMGREDMEALLGGKVSPSRVKCAMLPLVALKRGMESFGVQNAEHPPR